MSAQYSKVPQYQEKKRPRPDSIVDLVDGKEKQPFTMSIASENRAPALSIGSHDFKLNISTPGPYDTIALYSVYIPATRYNVNVSCNMMYWTHTTAFSASIPVGYYTTATLPAAIQTAMNAVDSNSYACTISSLTGMMTITGSAAFNFTFFTNGPNKNSAGRIMGYGKIDGTSNATQVATQVVQLQVPSPVFIHFSDSSATVFTPDNMTCGTFIVNQPLGSQQIFLTSPELHLQSAPFPYPCPSYTHVALYERDMYGMPIPYDLNNADWNCTLIFS
jgi:hypothetical protein